MKHYSRPLADRSRNGIFNITANELTDYRVLENIFSTLTYGEVLMIRNGFIRISHPPKDTKRERLRMTQADSQEDSSVVNDLPVFTADTWIHFDRLIESINNIVFILSRTP